MKCNRCGASVSPEETERVLDSFDADNAANWCFACNAELWQEREQWQAMNNPPQDEGD